MGRHHLLHGEISERILAAFYQVYRELGPGFLESVYAKGMERTLTEMGMSVRREVPTSVYFSRGMHRRVSGRHDRRVRCTLGVQAGDRLDPNSEAQTLNCLKASHVELAFILYFGPKPAFKRLIMTNDRKVLP